MIWRSSLVDVTYGTHISLGLVTTFPARFFCDELSGTFGHSEHKIRVFKQTFENVKKNNFDFNEMN